LPEATLLYEVVRAELRTFFAAWEEAGRGPPGFVRRELLGYVRCGVLGYGFCRVHCDHCGHDEVVAFSCKGRGFCPSCIGRRMNDTAARWSDALVPEVPLRQWVLTLPPGLRHRLGRNARMLTTVLASFVRSIFAWQRRRARRIGVADGRCGAVAVIQRAGSALELNPHYHVLVLDGVYALDRTGAATFHPLSPPTAAEVAQQVRAVRKKALGLLRAKGSPTRLEGWLEEDDADDTATTQLYAAAARRRTLFGPLAGAPVDRLVDGSPEQSGDDPQRLCAAEGGFNLHAEVRVRARDASARERLFRYLLRPPLANDALSLLPDGRVG